MKTRREETGYDREFHINVDLGHECADVVH